MTTTQTTVDEVPVTLDERGSGRVALVLHGGGGPATVAPIAAHLGAGMHAVMPTHPGWDGTPRPDRVASVGDLAALYLDLLAARGVGDAVLVGNSIGGWLALEMALRDTRGSIAALVVIDSMGITVEGEPMTDFFALDARQVADTSFHDGDRFYVDPATVPEDQARRQAANMVTLRAMAGDPYMHDPTLRDRLGEVTVATEVIWGDSDGIVTPGYGRALAALVPDARFELVPDAGHLPQIEQPAATFALIDGFLGLG